MSDIERGERPGRDSVEASTSGDDRENAPGGEISERRAGSIEEIEKESAAGGMEGEADPGA